jgi:hypothetical protein
MHTSKRALILNAPEGYREVLGEVPEALQIEFGEDEISGRYDFVHLFVHHSKDLEALIDRALDTVEHDALLWISYPKGSSGVKTDINRDSIWEAMKPKGIRPVTQVAVDEVWSALRFRPSEAVGS